MYIKLIFKQTIYNKQLYSQLDCTNTEILISYVLYIPTVHAFGYHLHTLFCADTYTWRFRPPLLERDRISKGDFMELIKF